MQGTAEGDYRKQHVHISNCRNPDEKGSVRNSRRSPGAGGWEGRRGGRGEAWEGGWAGWAKRGRGRGDGKRVIAAGARRVWKNIYPIARSQRSDFGTTNRPSKRKVPGHEAALDFQKAFQNKFLKKHAERIASPPTVSELFKAPVVFTDPCDDCDVLEALVRCKCTTSSATTPHLWKAQFICTPNPFGPNMVCWHPVVGS